MTENAANNPTVAEDGRGERRRRTGAFVVAIVAVVVIGFCLLPSDVLRRPTPIRAAVNPNAAEGAAWWAGRLHLDPPVGEIVERDGRWFNIYPPLVSFIAAAAHPFSPEGVPGWLFGAVVFIALPVLAFATFARAGGGPRAGALLTVVYLFGSPLLPVVLHALRSQLAYHVNQVFSQVGLLLMLFELLGRRRIWVMGAGLALGAWSRQLMLLYAPVLLVAALLNRRDDETRNDVEATLQRSTSATVGIWSAAVVFAVGPMLVLNALRFGNPLDSGYARLSAFEGSGFGPEIFAGAEGPFSWRYVPRNAYYMHVAPPRAEWVADRLMHRSDPMGTSIWITTPILVLLLAALPLVCRDRCKLALLVCSLAVMGVLLFYFNTGYAQRGYSRFTLDFLAVWFVLLAPVLRTRVGLVAGVVLTAWSVAYYYWILS